MSSDSKQWALDQLEKANTIFEPDQVRWRIQIGELVLWALEVGLICYLVFRVFFG